jgi:AcrR family transcriptional regulator
MRAIAERVEYTPTAIYHHFESKEALITELCRLDFRALGQAFFRIEGEADPIERLRRLGEAYVEFAIAHPNHYQLMFMTTRPQGVAEVAHGDPTEDAYALLRAACAEAVASNRMRPGIDDPDALAQILWAGLHGLVSLRIIKTHDPWLEWRDVRESARLMSESLMRGLLRDTV